MYLCVYRYVCDECVLPVGLDDFSFYNYTKSDYTDSIGKCPYDDTELFKKDADKGWVKEE